MHILIVRSGDNNYEENKQEDIFIEDLIEYGIVIIATGPLTTDNLSKGIMNLIGEKSLYFYDAAAPIIEKNSINFVKKKDILTEFLKKLSLLLMKQ